MMRHPRRAEVSTSCMTTDYEAPTTLAEVTALRHRGHVSAGDYLGRVQDCRDAAYWRTWALRALLVLGAVHVLAGVVFFFAYNWDALSPFSKFGIVQSGVVLSFLVGLFLELHKPAGQAMLIAASVFTGVLFAVIGQVYQTGADAWELFAAWTVLTLPWVLSSRSAAHWMFWVVLCLTAVSLYGGQVLLALGHLNEVQLSTALGLLPLLFLAAREIGLHRGLDWLDGNWLRRSLVVLSCIPLFWVAVAFVFDTDDALVGFVTFVLVTAALGYVYLRVLPDYSVLAIQVALASLLLMAIGGRLIFEFLEASNAGSLTFGLFLLGAWCVFLMSAVVRLLRSLHTRLQEGGAHVQ
jgi:uncharacterized membrane protein